MAYSAPSHLFQHIKADSRIVTLERSLVITGGGGHRSLSIGSRFLGRSRGYTLRNFEVLRSEMSVSVAGEQARVYGSLCSLNHPIGEIIAGNPTGLGDYIHEHNVTDNTIAYAYHQGFAINSVGALAPPINIFHVLWLNGQDAAVNFTAFCRNTISHFEEGSTW